MASLLAKSDLDRASARVCFAADQFGEEQGRIAKLWVSDLRDNTINPFELLEQQVERVGKGR